jgi:hypothetical protein
MSIDRYTKTVLTVIALCSQTSFGWAGPTFATPANMRVSYVGRSKRRLRAAAKARRTSCPRPSDGKPW